MASFLEEQSWFFSLVVHFQEWLLILSLLSLFITPWLTRFRCGLASFNFLILLFYSWTILPYWGALIQKNETNEVKTGSMNAFYANLNSQNQEKHLLINELKKNNPDLVLLVEFNNSWAHEIKTLKPLYPYSKMIILEGNFGMAVLSRTLLEVENVFVDRLNKIPSLFLKTQSPIGALNLVLIHAHPPIGRYGTIIQNQYLETLSRRIEDLNSPLLVCGDFNTTPWSSLFQKFLRNSSLEFNKNHLTPNTWPTSFLIPGLPIDHCLSRGLRFSQYNKGPDIGSDHWPLVIRLSTQ